MKWTHFEYMSGANPYISTTEANKRKIFRKYKKLGIEVEKIRDGFYLIHDKMEEN